MTIEEVFSTISSHMVEGIMFHDQMTNYFHFLGLHGYSKQQSKHFEKENKNFRKVTKYYMDHYHKLIPSTRSDNPQIIPAPWFNVRMSDVDQNTRRNAVKSAFTKWIEWEKRTYDVLLKAYAELVSSEEYAAAEFINGYLTKVDYELEYAENKLNELSMVDFDMRYILQDQQKVEE
jgi:hypothetical protein